MTAFNGYKSWNQWNVALYISNEYNLYLAAVKAKKTARPVRTFLELTGIRFGDKTPDGGIYNRISILNAINEVEE